MRLVPVSPAKAGTAWPYVEAWVEQALRRGKADLSPGDVCAHLERGSMQLWLVWGGGRPYGAVVTELIESVRGRSCNIVVAAGETFDAWGHLQEDLARWAATRGCVRLSLVGRRGWARRLKGWREAAVILERQTDG